MSQKTSRPAYRKRKGATRAQSADRHALYEQSVQCVESEIDMVDENFRKHKYSFSIDSIDQFFENKSGITNKYFDHSNQSTLNPGRWKPCD